MSDEPPPQTSLPNAEAWYLANGQKKEGPYDRQTIADMIADDDIGPDHLVWSKGMPEWLPLRSSPLADFLPGDVPPPPPVPQTTAPPPIAPKPMEKVYPLQPLRSNAWVWWSLVAPGFPQIIFGQPEKALVLSAAAFVIILFTAGLGFLIVAPLALIDAMKVRETVVRRGWVGKWEWFPS